MHLIQPIRLFNLRENKNKIKNKLCPSYPAWEQIYETSAYMAKGFQYLFYADTMEFEVVRKEIAKIPLEH